MDALEVIDQPTDEIVGDQQVVDEIDQPEDDTQQIEQKTEATDKVDGRKFNSEWSKALKELRELYPDKADMLTKLRDAYGRSQALTEVAPKGLEDVRAWKSTLDALGGSEAAAEMMQRVAEQESMDSRIEAGDFSVVGELPENLQKGFYQMLPDALSHLSEIDEKAFSAAIMPHFAAALSGTGMGDHLKKMYAQAGDNEPLKELIKQQYDWFQQQTQGKGQMTPGAKTVDPTVQRLQAELDSRRANDDKSFVDGIAASTNQYVEQAFTKNAEVYLKQLGLSEDQKNDLMDSFGIKLTEKLGADTAFQKQLTAYKSLKNRSPETINTYIRSKVDENAKSIIDGLVTARYGGRRTAQKTASTTTTANTGTVRVATAPPHSDWDMTKMEAEGYENTVKKGLFYLNGGKKVQLARVN